MPLFEITKKDEPCGECHIQPGETCDICGAKGEMMEENKEMQIDDYVVRSARSEKLLDALVIYGYKHATLSKLIGRINTDLSALDALKKSVIYGKELDVDAFCEQHNLTKLGKMEMTTLDSTKARLLHGILGILGEAGEVSTLIVEHIEKGTPLNTKKIIEELGDMMWYVALILRVLATAGSVMLAINFRKLMARYTEGYSDKEAIERSYESEQKAMDS